MKPKPRNCSIGVPYAVLFFSIVFLVSFPGRSWSQGKLLVPSSTVTRVAFVDHSHLRSEYKEFSGAREKAANEQKEKKNKLEEMLQVLEQKTTQQLTADSLAGGSQKETIRKDAETKRLNLINNFREDEKNRDESRILLYRQYEQKIRAAIEAVVNEGGFTDVKPLTSDSSGQKGVNVTDTILKKLN